MFFRQISDFDKNFKFLDRLNVLLFNVWKDDNAQAYKTQSMEQLEMFYRNYVNEMRQKSNEMKALEQEINEALGELDRVGRETVPLATNPEIHGCTLCRAYGKVRRDMSGTEAFVITPKDNRDRLDEIAYSRCHEVYDIDKVSVDSPL